jgi:hypothetical protein
MLGVQFLLNFFWDIRSRQNASICLFDKVATGLITDFGSVHNQEPVRKVDTLFLGKHTIATNHGGYLYDQENLVANRNNVYLCNH